ncbi:MAG: type II and III secretion system protein [Ignavibacteriae bacterium]|nr:type II and III secretion system protein [Ignavibacteriota bacterium]
MNQRRVGIVVLLLVSVWTLLDAQQRTARQDEMVSFKRDLSYSQAIAALSEVSKRATGKPVVDPSPLEATIGVDVESKHWVEALQMILLPVGRTFKEESDYFLITSVRTGASGSGTTASVSADSVGGKEPINIDSREVLITTIFFSLDVSKSQEYGFDWSFSFLKGRDSVLTTLSAPATRSALQVDYLRPYRYGDILSTLQFFSQSGVGDVIASPRMIVRSSETGRFQVGQDISVTERLLTSTGTTTTVRQIPTGTIVTLKPIIMKEGNVDFVYLDLDIERSAAITTGDLPTIDRNSTKTSMLLVNGEEVFLSGLYFNQEQVTRTGVPLLKDLPWWVFGLRYLFGSDSRQEIRRELVILMKAEILPTLRERAAQQTQENALELQRKKFQEDLERLKTKNKEDQ